MPAVVWVSLQPLWIAKILSPGRAHAAGASRLVRGIEGSARKFVVAPLGRIALALHSHHRPSCLSNGFTSPKNHRCETRIEIRARPTPASPLDETSEA